MPTPPLVCPPVTRTLTDEEQKTLKREFAALQGGASGAVDDGSSDEGGEPKRKKLKLRLGGKASATAAGDDAASAADEKPETSVGDGDEVAAKKDGGPPTVKAWLKEQLAALEEVKDHGRKLIGPFEDLPDRVEWKQYYDVIPNPIAFGMIRVRLLSSWPAAKAVD